MNLYVMNEILKIREILGTLELPEGECELSASAVAEYAEGTGNLVVRLDAAVHPCDTHYRDLALTLDWLPKGQTVSEFSPIEEAGEIARDAFRRWVRQIRASAPALHKPSFT